MAAAAHVHSGLAAALAAALAATVLASVPAKSDHLPVIVVPGRPGVPVMINGYDATGAVVYGDYGLYRPGHVAPQVYGPALISGPSGHAGYYPATGQRPRLGRQEIDPGPGHASKSGGDYYRSWSARSQPNQVTEYPPFDPPPVIVAPRGRPRGNR